MKTFLLSMILSVLALASEGPRDTGGGSIVYLEPNVAPVLLDFIQEDLKVIDESSANKSFFEQSSANQEIMIKDLPVFPMVVKRLDLWRQSHPTLIDLIDKALIGMRWFSVSREVKDAQQFFVSDFLKSRSPNYKIEPVVLYHVEFGAVMSAPKIRLLNDSNWVGLIIHEAIRHIQIRYSAHLTNEELQRLTAVIALGEPGEVELPVIKPLGLWLEIEKNVQHLEKKYQQNSQAICLDLADLKADFASQYCESGLDGKKIGELIATLNRLRNSTDEIPLAIRYQAILNKLFDIWEAEIRKSFTAQAPSYLDAMQRFKTLPREIKGDLIPLLLKETTR